MSGRSRIDLERGEIALACGLVVGPHLDEAALLDARPPGLAPHVHNGAYRSYRLAELPIADRTFVPVLFFHDGAAMETQLHAVDPEMTGWDNYSEERTVELKRRNDSLLETLAGQCPPLRFAWGKADSWFDPRSGSAAISLTYDGAA